MYILWRIFNNQGPVVYLLVAALVALGITMVLPMVDYIAAWFVTINISAFLAFARDKFAAKAGRSRTPEITLLTLGFAGGFPGVFLGRKVFNHKTKKLAFIIPMWTLFALQIVLSGWFFGGFDTIVQRWTTDQPATAATTHGTQTAKITR